MFERIGDTIGAISSSLQGGARGIIRLSGPQTFEILSEALGRTVDIPDTAVCQSIEYPLEKIGYSLGKTECSSGNMKSSPEDMGYAIGDSAKPANDSAKPAPCFRTVPADVYLWPEGRSYTGERSAEIHTFGSLPVLRRILSDLYTHGVRAAEGGEFTFRAFISGKLDLTQAEAVLGLIEASDVQTFRTAASQIGGGFSDSVKAIRAGLVETLINLEAGFDFAEEEISFLSHEQLQTQLEQALVLLQNLHGQIKNAAHQNYVSRVVLVGNPNAGKSRLFNCLVGQDTAIVSQIQGSTRDYLTRQVRWNNVSLELVDTAGQEYITENTDYSGADAGFSGTGSISIDAQRLAHQQSEEAELLLWCVPAAEITRGWQPLPQWSKIIQEASRQSSDRLIFVITKADLADNPSRSGTDDSVAEETYTININDGPVNNKEVPDPILEVPEIITARGIPFVVTSSATQSGLLELRNAVMSKIQNRTESRSMVLSSTSDRCESYVRAAMDSISAALELATHGRKSVENMNLSESISPEGIHSTEGRSFAESVDFMEGVGLGEEWIAEHIRQALNVLGGIAGEVYNDEILSGVFSRFCIGK